MCGCAAASLLQVFVVTSPRSLFLMYCRSDEMASLPISRLVCVGLVTSLLVIYLLAGAGGGGGRSDLEKREVRDWGNLDLRTRDLPSDIGERVNRVKIEESHHDIHGTNTFAQVSNNKLYVQCNAMQSCDKTMKQSCVSYGSAN